MKRISYGISKIIFPSWFERLVRVFRGICNKLAVRCSRACYRELRRDYSCFEIELSAEGAAARDESARLSIRHCNYNGVRKILLGDSVSHYPELLPPFSITHLRGFRYVTLYTKLWLRYGLFSFILRVTKFSNSGNYSKIHKFKKQGTKSKIYSRISKKSILLSIFFGKCFIFLKQKYFCLKKSDFFEKIGNSIILALICAWDANYFKQLYVHHGPCCLSIMYIRICIFIAEKMFGATLQCGGEYIDR